VNTSVYWELSHSRTPNCLPLSTPVAPTPVEYRKSPEIALQLFVFLLRRLVALAWYRLHAHNGPNGGGTPSWNIEIVLRRRAYSESALL
jgi:hypothetical protein